MATFFTSLPLTLPASSSAAPTSAARSQPQTKVVLKRIVNGKATKSSTIFLSKTKIDHGRKASQRRDCEIYSGSRPTCYRYVRKPHAPQVTGCCHHVISQCLAMLVSKHGSQLSCDNSNTQLRQWLHHGSQFITHSESSYSNSQICKSLK